MSPSLEATTQQFHSALKLQHWIRLPQFEGEDAPHLGGAARSEVLEPAGGCHGFGDGGPRVYTRGGEEAGGPQAHWRGRLQHVLVRRPQRRRQQPHRRAWHAAPKTAPQQAQQPIRITLMQHIGGLDSRYPSTDLDCLARRPQECTIKSTAADEDHIFHR